MKRLTILLIAMATLVAAGCDRKDEIPENKDSISLSAQQQYTDSSSKKIEVSVVSERLKTLDALIRR